MKVLLILLVFLFLFVCKNNGDSFSEKLNDLIEMDSDDVAEFFENSQHVLSLENDELADDENNDSAEYVASPAKYHCINPQQTTYQKIYTNDTNLESKLNVSLPIAFVIHGWMNSFHASGWMNETCRDWVRYVDTTVCAVDWSKLSHAMYVKASKKHVYTVSKEIANFIVFLTQNGIDKDNIIIAGHSLGAQIAGLVGKEIKKHLLMLKAIYGLDPAGPFFTHPRKISKRNRLYKGDAKYVQILHTSMSLGTSIKIGDSDFWANGGTQQPGCKVDVACSHSRAYQIFRASLNPIHAFYGTECKSSGIFGYLKLNYNACTKNDHSDRIGIHGEHKNGNFNMKMKRKIFPFL